MNRSPQSFPLENPASKVSKEAAALHARWVKIDAELRALPERQIVAQKAVESAKANLAEAVKTAQLTGKAISKRDEAKLSQEITDAQTYYSRAWAAEAEGVSSAALTAEGEYAAFVEDNLEALLEEIAPDAYATAAQLGERVAGLEKWQAAQSTIQRKVTAFTRLCSDPDQDLRASRSVSAEGQAIKALKVAATNPDVMLPDGERLRKWLDNRASSADRLAEKRNAAKTGPAPNTPAPIAGVIGARKFR